MLDAAALLGGNVSEARSEARITALVALTGQRHRISRTELDHLLSIPAGRWVEVDPNARDLVQSLLHKGLLLSDGDDPHLALQRDRDGALTDNAWNLYAALYHYMTQWSDVEIADGEEEATALALRSRLVARHHVAAHGPPPDAFADYAGKGEVKLPGKERDGALYRALVARRTTRSYDTDTPMTIDELDSVLRYVFGRHGHARNAADVVCIKRTSPSGGALHPIEAYPLISNVADIAPGLYHYNVRSHSLVLLEDFDAPEARQLATFFMCGQKYFGTAHAAFILTARFSRNHWKYRRHQKAYAGILMDAAHLSQTLYLVSTELGLGAFVTIAINSRDIERRLGLDGVSEGVVAVAGCGRRAAGDSPLELRFSPEQFDA